VKPLFTFGPLLATPGALIAIEASGDSLFTVGDWGEIDSNDRKENQPSLELRIPLLRNYSFGV
jgi:hypothetical protein